MGLRGGAKKFEDCQGGVQNFRTIVAGGGGVSVPNYMPCTSVRKKKSPTEQDCENHSQGYE